MTTINIASPAAHSHRNLFTEAPTELKDAHDAHPLSAQAEAKLRQLQTFVDNLGRALGRQTMASGRYVTQLTASQQFGVATAAQLGLAVPPSTLGPHSTELLAHPEVLEELKKHREREARFAGELKSAIESAERPNVELLRMFGFLDFLNPPGTPDSREDKTEIGDEPVINPHDKDASGLIWDSHSEFYEMIGQLIAALQQNWLSKYQDAMTKFLEFYEKFADALDKIKHGTSGYDNEVLIEFGEMRDALLALVETYGGDAGTLADFDSRGGAQAFIDSIGLPGLKVSPETGVPADGKYRVKIDLGAVTAIIASTPAGSGQVRWDVARYNAWLAKKDGNVEEIKHVSKVLGEKLNEMTQKFDNIVKILSSTIDKINEADMSFVRGL